MKDSSVTTLCEGVVGIVCRFSSLHVLCAFMSALALIAQTAAAVDESAGQSLTLQRVGAQSGTPISERLPLEGNIAFGGMPAVLAEAPESPNPQSSGQETRFAADSAPPAEPPRGFGRVILAPVTPEQSEYLIHSRDLPQNLNSGYPGPPSAGYARSARSSAAGAPPIDPVITELARALRHDPDLIYRYVHDNIAYYPIWGVQKGALGTVIDKAGTGFDQAALMVSLLRESGYVASYQKGRIELDAAQVQDWLGVDVSNVCAVLNLLGQGQVPVSSIQATASGSCPGVTAALVRLKLDHVWVKVEIDGSDYVFDPGFKSHVERPGIDLVAATGYDAATYLDDATSGASIDEHYVQYIDRFRIRENLTGYAMGLAHYLRANLPSGTLVDVLGGKTIIPMGSAQLRRTLLPYQDTSVVPVEWAEIPDSYRPVLSVAYRGIDASYTSDKIYGKRLSITYDAGNQPVLMLDGVVQSVGNQVTPGSVGNVTIGVTHGAYTGVDQVFTQQLRAGGTFLIANGWGPVGSGLVEHHRKHLAQVRAEGKEDGSEAVLGSALAALSAAWIAQVNRADAIADRLADTTILFHHQVGIAGYNDASYVDLPGNMLSVVSQYGDPDTEAAAFFGAAMHASILESVAVEQTSGIGAVSTVKLIDIAVSDHLPIYDATSTNYSAAVRPNLSGCDSMLAGFQQAVSAGHRLILPGRCDLTENRWSGIGYFDIRSVSGRTSFGAIIGGGFAGGFSTQNQPAFELTARAQERLKGSAASLLQSTGLSFADPIDMLKGHFLYEHEDLTLGEGGFPRSLSFKRYYSSGLRNSNRPLGRGWTHNLSARATMSSDGFQGLGEDSALDAVASVVELMVSLDLLADPLKPLDKMVVAALGQAWFGDQLVDNTVVVQQGLNGEVFTRLPDGSYNPPPGNSARLVESADGTYSYETLHGARFDFDAAGRISQMQESSGMQARYAYNGSELVEVRNSLGRSLTLSYAGGRLSSVSDGSRSIRFGQDQDGNLAAVTDMMGQSTRFEYDLPGRMTKIVYPSHPTNAFVTNVYDSLGRVETQTNANGATYEYYFAGTRSEEVGPYGSSRISFPNVNGKLLKSVDPLGRVTTHEYDGQQRIIETVYPEGNRLAYSYDDQPCAGQQHCTHNLASLRQVPKPASGLPELVTSYLYDGVSNRVSSITDPRGKVAAFTYTERGEPLTVTRQAGGAGQNPITTYGYSSYSAAGFPEFHLPTSVTQKIDADSSTTTSMSYDPGNHHVPRSTIVDSGAGGLNLITSYSYDAIGNLSGVDGPRTGVADSQTLIYDAERRLVQTRDAVGNLSALAYDPDGRLVRTSAQSDNGWLVSCRSYSPSGRLLRSWGPGETGSETRCPTAAAPVSVTDYEYDDIDRLVRTTEHLAPDDGGNRVTEIDYLPDDLVQATYSAVGTLREQARSRYTYTPNGHVASVQDANGNLTSYEYDGHGRKTKTRFPDPLVAGLSSASDYEQYGYDANGNLTSLRKRNGANISFAYDDLDRRTNRIYPSSAEDVTFSYDLLGRRTGTSYADGSYGVTHVYDNAGRVLSTDSGGKALQYQYDTAGNRTRITWPDGFFVTLVYDALNRPTEIREQGVSSLASYSYDALSRRHIASRGNSTATTYGYGNEAGLTSLFHDLQGASHDITYRYTRNQARQITQTQFDNYRFLSLPQADASSEYSANGLNQYVQVDDQVFEYDANANLTGDGSWTYGYDMENRLVSASGPGMAATLVYDPLGRLRRTEINGAVSELLYDGTDLIGEYDGDGTLGKRYIHGPVIDEPVVSYDGAGTADKRWFYADHLGSVVATADNSGEAGTPYGYGPFGTPDRTDGPRFRYTGQQLIAPLGLYHYKARFYSPTLGRFLQTDPIGYEDDLNHYAYVGNDPLSSKDPEGLVKWVDFGFGLVDFASSTGEVFFGLGLMIASPASGPGIPAAFLGGTVAASHGLLGMVNSGVAVKNALMDTSDPGAIESVGGALFGESGEKLGKSLDLYTGFRPTVLAAGSINSVRDVYDLASGLNSAKNTLGNEVQSSGIGAPPSSTIPDSGSSVSQRQCH